MVEFCRTLQARYCMNKASFTELDYYITAEDVLFNCREVERLRLNLPFQLVGRHCAAATMILANTFKAFANRPEEDSTPLKVLLLENLPDIAVYHLWMNPIDVMNIMKVIAALEHLVITLRRHETDPQRSGLFGSCLWSMVENAESLQSLCFIGMDNDDRPPRGLKQTRVWQMAVDEWRGRTLPAPQIMLSHLRCLELKRVEILPSVLIQAAERFGSTLEELYLNEVYLKAEQGWDWNMASDKVLWIGLPNQRPPDDGTWVAMELRSLAPNLRICRASFLAYDHYMRDDSAWHPEFDLIDPCGLGRSVSQRFIEVVMGIRQPSMPTGEPVEFLPADSMHDHLVTDLKPRTRALRVTEYDTNAYQIFAGNTTSRWYTSGIDQVFQNCNPGTLDKLHFIAETACQGMNQLSPPRSEWTGDNVMQNEYANTLAGLDEP